MTEIKEKPKKKATQNQIKLIWTLSNKLGLDRDQVHEMAGVKSLKNLSSGRAFSLGQKLLNQVNNKKHPAYRYTPEGRREIWEHTRKVLFLPEGVSTIRTGVSRQFQNKIISQVVNYFNTPEGTVKWLKKTFKTEKIIDEPTAWKVTSALEEMLRRKGHPAGKHTGVMK